MSLRRRRSHRRLAGQMQLHLLRDATILLRLCDLGNKVNEHLLKMGRFICVKRPLCCTRDLKFTIYNMPEPCHKLNTPGRQFSLMLVDVQSSHMKAMSNTPLGQSLGLRHVHDLFEARPIFRKRVQQVHYGYYLSLTLTKCVVERTFGTQCHTQRHLQLMWLDLGYVTYQKVS